VPNARSAFGETPNEALAEVLIAEKSWLEAAKSNGNMKVLKVIHGFPPDYMAGSEVYSYHLVKALSRQVGKINVFTIVENEFDKEYDVYDEAYDGIEVHRVNKFRRG